MTEEGYKRMIEEFLRKPPVEKDKIPETPKKDGDSVEVEKG